MSNLECIYCQVYRVCLVNERCCCPLASVCWVCVERRFLLIYVTQQDTQERLQQEEDARNQLFQNKKKLEQEASGLKKDIEDLELALQKV